MSITYDHGDIVWQCDGVLPDLKKGFPHILHCLEALETNTSNFDAARNTLTRQRWKAIKKGLEWKHLCPSCLHYAREAQ